MKRYIITIWMLLIVLMLSSCGNTTSSVIPVDNSYIVTHNEPAGLNQRAAVDIDTLCKNAVALVEFTVTGEPQTTKFTYRDEEEIAAIDKDAYSEEDYNALVALSVLEIVKMDMPVRYDKVYFNAEPETGDYSDTVLRFNDYMLEFKESFPEGARFLGFTNYVPYFNVDKSAPTCDIFLFYIDENDKLVPVIDMAPLNEYKDLSVDDFVKKVTDIRNEKAG